MTARHAAYIALALMLVVSTFAAYQLGKGRMATDVRVVLAMNLLGSGVLWLRTDKPIEGTIVDVLSRTHGITTADLLVTLPVALAAAVMLQPFALSAAPVVPRTRPT